MNAENFPGALESYQAQMRSYINNVFPGKAGEISLRFIDDNFRMQGWQGATFQPWPATKRGGTILVKTSTLRRGSRFTTQPGVTHVKNDVIYAAVHNNGFNGLVEVKAHQRRLLTATKTATGRIKISGKPQMQTIHGVSGIQNVKAHTRHMNIPQRKFFPVSYDDSPVLLNLLKTEMISGLQNIFNH